MLIQFQMFALCLSLPTPGIPTKISKIIHKMNTSLMRCKEYIKANMMNDKKNRYK
jgi:hypothetical protein